MLAIGNLRAPQPFDSTDRYLEWLIHAPNKSQQILQIFDACPRDRRVALVLPDAGKQSAFVNQLIVYLAWPRDVQWIALDQPTAVADLNALNTRTPAAIVFWGVKPPAELSNGIRIGPEQSIVSFPDSTSNRP